MTDADGESRMTGEDEHGFLWWWTLPELALVAALLGLLVASLLGHETVFSSASRLLRVAAAAFLAVELLIPIWVYLDLRRRPDANAFWVHVAAMPGINLFGLLGYLQQRKPDRED